MITVSGIARLEVRELDFDIKGESSAATTSGAVWIPLSPQSLPEL
jgi:hypothetical protein